MSRLAPARFEPSLSRMREAAFAGDMAAVDREAAWARQHGGLVNELLARSRFAMWWRDRARARECLELAEQIESHVIRDNVTPLLRMVLGERGLDDAWIRARFRAHVASRRMLSFREQMSYEILAWQGEIDAALDHLERSAVLPLIDVAWMDRCPVLAPLRALPRFAAARAVVTARIDDMWS